MFNVESAGIGLFFNAVAVNYQTVKQIFGGLIGEKFEAALSIMNTADGNYLDGEIKNFSHQMPVPRFIEALAALDFAGADGDLITFFNKRSEFFDFGQRGGLVEVGKQNVVAGGLHDSGFDAGGFALMRIFNQTPAGMGLYP